MPAVRCVATFVIPGADGRSTEEWVAAGAYGYAHSCVTSEVFPVRPASVGRREVSLLEFDGEVGAPAIITAAARLGLRRPAYEDALVFGASWPDAQREAPIVFLHDPWLGYFGRLDVLCLWDNAGRREIGLEGFETTWRAGYRFAFVRPDGIPSAARSGT